MNALNGALTWLFDLLLTPLEAVGPVFALFVVSGVFGVLALIAFKHISWQKGIKRTKDRIKGHMIEIRLYQNDLGLVSKAIGKVLLRNFQYLGLNFGPFVPLAIPFVFVVAQMVVRYGFAGVPVVEQPVAELLAGAGSEVRIELAPGHERAVGDLELVLPEGVVAASPLVRSSDGLAFQEIVPTRAGEFDLVVRLGGQEVVKKLHAGRAARRMQPERGAGLWSALLFPAEETLPAASGIARVEVQGYDEAAIGWLPVEGPGGVILWFVVFSMAVGFALLKPLGVQI